MHRITLLLDDETRRAAEELALRYNCSTSEAIRRAIVSERARARGVTDERRERRLAAFRALCQAFDGHDADAEIDELEAQDEHA